MNDDRDVLLEEEASQLAKEIVHVYETVQEVIASVSKRIGAVSKTPAYIQILPGKENKHPNMRDYILYCHENEQLGKPTSANDIDEFLQQKALEKRQITEERARLGKSGLTSILGLDVVSNRNILDIDHFRSQSDMMKTLKRLERNQPLLAEIRRKLREDYHIPETILAKIIPLSKKSTKLAATEEETEIDDDSADEAIEEETEEGVAKHFTVTGLINLYINYPKNLWPVSGPINREKSSAAPLGVAIDDVFTSLRTIHQAGYEAILDKIIADSGLPSFDLSVQDKEKVLKGMLLKQFEDNTLKYGILPFIEKDGMYICELDFFMQTALGQHMMSVAQRSSQLSASFFGMMDKLALRNSDRTYWATHGMMNSVSQIRNLSETESTSSGHEHRKGLPPPLAKKIVNFEPAQPRSEQIRSLEDQLKLLRRLTRCAKREMAALKAAEAGELAITSSDAKQPIAVGIMRSEEDKKRKITQHSTSSAHKELPQRKKTNSSFGTSSALTRSEKDTKRKITVQNQSTTTCRDTRRKLKHIIREGQQDTNTPGSTFEPKGNRYT